MKRERIEDCVFDDIPTDLYPLLLRNYTEEVVVFRRCFTLRCVSTHARKNIDCILGQVRHLAQPIMNVLCHDRQLGPLHRLARLNLRWNRRITNHGIVQLTALTRLTMPRGDESCSLEGLDKLSDTLTYLSVRGKDNLQPKELSLLTGLRRLNLRDSILKGDFSGLTTLRHLREVRTSATDDIFAHLTMLSTLDFRYVEREEDAICAMSFRNLTSLRLSGTPLIHRQTREPWCCLLGSLTRLDLVYTCLAYDFTLPVTLTRLSLIGWMHPNGRVQDNVLRGLTNLRRLNLRQSTWFTNDALLHVPQLTHLDLSFTNRIDGQALVGFASSLRRLNLRHCASITNPYLSQMTALTHLTLTQSGTIGEASLLPLTGLRTLICSGITMSNQCLSGFTSLTTLDLNPAKISYPSLALLTNLETLVIQDTAIAGYYCAACPSLPRLKKLSAPQLLLSRENLLHCPMLTDIACVANETTVCSDFDHLARLASLSLCYQGFPDYRVLYAGLCKLGDRGVIVGCSL